MLKILKRLFNLRGDLGGLFGNPTKGDPYNNVQVPQWYTDPMYTQNEQSLTDLGQNILSGNLPSFYSGLGQANSPQYQALVARTTGQVNDASAQQAAASGTDRSGVAATAAAGNLASVIPQMNYADYLNSMQQKAGLLTLGANVTNAATGYGLTNQGQHNSFDQTQFLDTMGLTQAKDTWNKEAAAAQGKAQGNFFNLIGGPGLSNIMTGNNPDNYYGSNSGQSGGGQSGGNQYGMLGQLFQMLSGFGGGSGGGMGQALNAFGGGVSTFAGPTEAEMASMMLM